MLSGEQCCMERRRMRKSHLAEASRASTNHAGNRFRDNSIAGRRPLLSSAHRTPSRCITLSSTETHPQLSQTPLLVPRAVSFCCHVLASRLSDGLLSHQRHPRGCAARQTSLSCTPPHEAESLAQAAPLHTAKTCIRFGDGSF